MIRYIKFVSLNEKSHILLHVFDGGMPQCFLPKNRKEWCEGFYTEFGIIHFGAIDEILTTDGSGWIRIWKRTRGQL